MGPQAPALGAARLPDALAGVPIWGAIWSTTTTTNNRHNPHAEVWAVCHLNRFAGAAILAAHAWRVLLIPAWYKSWPIAELGAVAVVDVRISRKADVSWS